MINDPIADLLTRIRNGYLARLAKISVPYSKIKNEILRILKKNKYIVSFEIEDLGNGKKDIVIELNDIRLTKYVPTFKRISKPGQRIYIKQTDIKKSRNGLGIYLVSTPKGVVTGYEARALNVGGELLCEVY
ncbi:MAG: 30S ribosomal protein S8 [Candidatus Gracilibacteria bacterium]|nr:30S ribosomal protein S8 [Candidatus Gracilibacteria bacterium]MDD2908854.1 30S ribosomal protein S8 [Candidatus Gracilibacteria bacterium]